VAFTQANVADKNDVAVVFQEIEAEHMTNLHLVNPSLTP
jgi:hypothetical protein